MNKKLYEYSYKLKKEKQGRDLKIIFAIICSILVISLVLNLLILPVRQFSSSMNPDMPSQSVLFVTPLDKTPKRGDVILVKPIYKNNKGFFHSVLNNFVVFFTLRQVNLNKDPNFPNTKDKLRRVVAIPGDTLYMKDYKVYVKPENEKHFLTEFELSKRPYNVEITRAPVDWDSSIGISGEMEAITLGPDEYFVLCDNRFATDDSRLWGALNKEDIEAKALFCIFPFNKLKLLF